MNYDLQKYLIGKKHKLHKRNKLFNKKIILYISVILIFIVLYNIVKFSLGVLNNSKNNNKNANQTVNSIKHDDEYYYELADSYSLKVDEAFKDDVINSYNKDRLINRRNEILLELEDKNNTKEEMVNLEKELNELIIKLAKMK